MLRVGGFQEYSPSQQKLFDEIHKIISDTYSKFGFGHIQTPAVESVDTLKKGGTEVASQIFGLFGLAQGAEDLKDYALHFDLTVPFARYVLDWRNELAFPFKRHQIQPVWRGERPQKGRYREFWQADVDVIWPHSDTNINEFYDFEIVRTLATALDKIISRFGIDQKITFKISDKNLAVGYISGLIEKHDFGALHEVLVLLDKKFKLGDQGFIDEFKKRNYPELFINDINDFLRNPLDGISKLDGNDQFKKGSLSLKNTFEKLNQTFNFENISFEYDPTIVRGLDYYTGIVFEMFIDGHVSLGSLGSGGRYEKFTDFLDKKQTFSGVGGSIGLSRLFSLLFEQLGYTPTLESSNKYFFVNFADNISGILDLMAKFRIAGFEAEIYPVSEKIGKQIQYAEKLGYKKVVMYGSTEKENGILKIKNLDSGEEIENGFDYSCGIIPLLKTPQGNKILLVQHAKGHRGIPKGHPEKGETFEQAGMRELFEETGLKTQKLIQNGAKTMKFTEGFFTTIKGLFKTVDYAISIVEDDSVNIDNKEIIDAQRFTFDQAIKRATHQGTQNLLRDVKSYCEMKNL